MEKINVDVEYPFGNDPKWEYRTSYITVPNNKKAKNREKLKETKSLERLLNNSAQLKDIPFFVCSINDPEHAWRNMITQTAYIECLGTEWEWVKEAGFILGRPTEVEMKGDEYWIKIVVSRRKEGEKKYLKCLNEALLSNIDPTDVLTKFTSTHEFEKSNEFIVKEIEEYCKLKKRKQEVIYKIENVSFGYEFENLREHKIGFSTTDSCMQYASHICAERDLFATIKSIHEFEDKYRINFIVYVKWSHDDVNTIFERLIR